MKKLLTLSWIFFHITLVTLGGGMAMLPVMQREFVEKRKWLTPEEMVDIVAVMQSLPGLVAVNMSILIGYRIANFAGAIVSAFSAVIAPFTIIVLLATGKSLLGDSPMLSHIFLGVRSAVAALILVSAINLGKTILKNKLSWFLGIIGFIASVFFEVEAINIVLFGFIVGIILLGLQNNKLKEEVNNK